MICGKCRQPGVENQAMGKTFWYCRTCKVEILLEPYKHQPAPGQYGFQLCNICGFLMVDPLKHDCNTLKSKFVVTDAGFMSDFSDDEKRATAQFNDLLCSQPPDDVWYGRITDDAVYINFPHTVPPDETI